MVSFRLLTASLATVSVAAGSSIKRDELAAVRPRTADVVTDKVVVLQKREFTTKTVRSFYRSLHEGTGLSKRDAAQMTLNSPTSTVLFQGYTAEVTIDGQKIPVLVSTSSSDLWVVGDGFNCVDDDGKTVDKGTCQWGTTLFKGAPSGGLHADQNFYVTYSDEEEAKGMPALGKVEIAGVTLENQTFGLVNETLWTGDNKTTGYLGIGYALLSSAYKGHNITADEPASRADDTTIVENLVKKDASYSSFAIGQDRKAGSPAMLAFGGLPPVQNDGKFAKVPIRTSKFYSPISKDDYYWYAFTPDAYEYDGYTKSNTTDRGGVTSHDDAMEEIVMLDIDLMPMLLHTDIVKGVARLYNPPAVMSSEMGAWYAPCNATAPKFSVKIAGQSFPVSKENMLMQDITVGDGASYVNKTSGVKMCSIAVQDGGNRPPFSLGNAFLKNVVTVFDYGAHELRFAAIPE